MIGRDPKLVVTAADDSFHVPTTDDPSWIETMWFPFWVPEESLSGSVRVWFSPNAGQQGGTVAGWRGQSQRLFADRWSEEFASAPNLLDLRVESLQPVESPQPIKSPQPTKSLQPVESPQPTKSPQPMKSRLHIECLAPLTHYRLRHTGPHSSLDLDFAAIMPANPVAPEESPGMFAGHFEQPGRVTGEVRYRDRSLTIDCYSIRDRSWGPRRMPDELRLGNAHGTAEGFGFFTYVNPTPAGVERITSGYLLRDGVEATIVEGVRETKLRDGLPVSVRLEATDAAGRTLTARGDCVNAMASNAGNGVYAVLNLIRWEHEGGVCWGENHDVWSEAAWLAAGRPKL